MRWHFTDRVDLLRPWEAIVGRKTVSLEEYTLLDPFGRLGDFPESLVVETCASLARWLVMASSGFSSTCILASVEKFVYTKRIGMSDSLKVSIDVADRGPEYLAVSCSVVCGGAEAARGKMTFSFVALPEPDAADAEVNWKEIHAGA